MPFGVDFEPDTGNSGSIRINYHRLYLGEAAQKSVRRHVTIMEESMNKQFNLPETIYATSPDFIFLLDANGIIEKVNRLQPGHREKDVVGQKASKFVLPEYREMFRKTFRQALATGQPQTLEAMVDLPDGLHYFLNRMNPIRLAEHGLSVVLIATDITERKQAEEKLESRTQELAERVKELKCLYAIDGISTRNEVSVTQILEEAALLIPQSWQYPEIVESRISFEGKEFRTKAFKKTKWRLAADIVIAHKKIGSIEVYYTEAMPEKHEGPFLREERNLIDSIATRLSQIIRRKRAEEALREERLRLQYILEGTNVGTWEWNIQSGETVFNERWANIIGYTLEEISPVSIETWQKFANPEDLKGSNEQLEEHYKGEREYYEIECRMKHKDGYWVWVLDRGKVFSWTDDGKPLMMFGTHQDITERKRTELALRESEGRLKYLSKTDGLTGLLNRRGWNECIAEEESRAQRYGHPSCVIVLDLDGLKAINDVHGHEAGDDLITRAAHAIKGSVRDIDKVARTGGDEFAVLAVECSIENTDIILKRIEEAFSAKEVQASWGIAMRDSDSGLKGALVKADSLMYEMKAKRRTRRST